MNHKEALKIYQETRKKLNAYGLVLSTTSFDQYTIAPKKGSKYRNEAMAYMYGEYFDIATNKSYVEAVNYLASIKLTGDIEREIKLAKKRLDASIIFTKEEETAFSLLQMQSNQTWQQAKKDSDYVSFEPYLKKLVDLSIKRAKKRNSKIKPYDVYLDDYEEGMTIKEYEKFFDLLKKELTPIIKKVNAKQDLIDDSFLYKYYPQEKQEHFLKALMKYMKYDNSWGYMGVSAHPFTNGLSHNDVRITTSYDEYNITSSIFSVIHEVGHAFFEHQVDVKYEGSLIHNDISSGMHESQSRFLENYIGRRKSFWVKLYPILQKEFPENLANVSLDQFVKAINVAKSSLIRTDADELTYPMHIMVRYEIEKGLFDGKLNTKNLNDVWKQMYKKYLGIEVPNDKTGILQDTHWSDGSFGYFPTYALGSAFGAQFIKQMEKEIDIDKALSTGRFNIITDWLKNNIQKYGARYNAEEVLVKVTGKKFNPKYYVDYLKKKYKALYQLK